MIILKLLNFSSTRATTLLFNHFDANSSQLDSQLSPTGKKHLFSFHQTFSKSQGSTFVPPLLPFLKFTSSNISRINLSMSVHSGNSVNRYKTQPPYTRNFARRLRCWTSHFHPVQRQGSTLSEWRAWSSLAAPVGTNTTTVRTCAARSLECTAGSACDHSRMKAIP